MNQQGFEGISRPVGKWAQALGKNGESLKKNHYQAENIHDPITFRNTPALFDFESEECTINLSIVPEEYRHL
jgi:hypothetical protein